MKRILIVEDSVTSAHAMSAFLEPFGNCEIAVNGKEGLDKYLAAHQKNKPFAIVCLDLKMPLMGGQEVMHKIREAERNKAETAPCKIVIITAAAQDDELIQVCNKECDGFLTKPITRKDLLREMYLQGVLDAREIAEVLLEVARSA